MKFVTVIEKSNFAGTGTPVYVNVACIQQVAGGSIRIGPMNVINTTHTAADILQRINEAVESTVDGAPINEIEW